MRPGEFRTDITPHPAGTHVLRCLGDLDLASAPACRAAVQQITAPRLVLDLRELRFLDSSGVAVLLAAQRRHPDGHLATCVTPGGPVARVLSLAGLEALLRVTPSLPDAVAALAPADNVPSPIDLDLPAP